MRFRMFTSAAATAMALIAVSGATTAQQPSPQSPPKEQKGVIPNPYAST